jgi:SAM-dependent methyltransferase
MKIINKIVFHIKNGTLFSSLRLIVIRKFFGKYEIPIGDNYVGNKAAIYDDHRDKDPFWIAEHNSMAHYLNRLDPIKNVLDAPFGTGRFAPLFFEYNLDINALDISKDMMEQARKKHPEAMSKAKIHIGGMSDMPYQDNSIDLVVCYRFLPWIVSFAEAEKSMQELSRVCKHYAILELCVGEHQTGKGKVSRKRTLWNRLNETELRNWVKGFDFEVIEVMSLYDDAEHPGLSAFLCKKIPAINC